MSVRDGGNVISNVVQYKGGEVSLWSCMSRLVVGIRKALGERRTMNAQRVLSSKDEGVEELLILSPYSSSVLSPSLTEWWKQNVEDVSTPETAFQSPMAFSAPETPRAS